METIEVHNIYTLYEYGTDVETPILSFSRPQDWGDSSRWHYHQCRVQFSYGGTVYINNCHLWQNVERNSVEAFQCIAQYLFMVSMPGRIEQLTGKEFLHGDDFWDESWGEIPPYYEEDEEDEEDDY